jgi:hypothetical protein
VKRKIPIAPLDRESSPINYLDYGYKFFVCVAEGFRKILATK